jgi:hypothetical protein
MTVDHFPALLELSALTNWHTCHVRVLTFNNTNAHLLLLLLSFRRDFGPSDDQLSLQVDVTAYISMMENTELGARFLSRKI